MDYPSWPLPVSQFARLHRAESNKKVRVERQFITCLVSTVLSCIRASRHNAYSHTGEKRVFPFAGHGGFVHQRARYVKHLENKDYVLCPGAVYCAHAPVSTPPEMPRQSTGTPKRSNTINCTNFLDPGYWPDVEREEGYRIQPNFAETLSTLYTCCQYGALVTLPSRRLFFGAQHLQSRSRGAA